MSRRRDRTLRVVPSPNVPPSRLDDVATLSLHRITFQPESPGPGFATVVLTEYDDITRTRSVRYVVPSLVLEREVRSYRPGPDIA